MLLKIRLRVLVQSMNATSLVKVKSINSDVHGYSKHFSGEREGNEWKAESREISV